jgi:hypothetical protein
MATATERTLTVQLPPGASYVDVSAIAGRANQRLYRQGMLYSMTVAYQGNNPVGAPGQIEVGHLPNNWAIRNAHQLARKMWLESTKDERKNGARFGRWNDFRVYFDGTHTDVNNLNTPFGSLGLGSGEILFTNAVRQDSGALVQYQFLGNTTGTRFGMLNEYDRMADTDTDTPATGANSMAYRTLMAELTNEQADQIQEEGDNPPYDPENMQNNLVIPFHTIYHPTVSNRTSTPMMHVPAGLLSLVNRGDEQFINITLKAGSYKGVAAEVL